MCTPQLGQRVRLKKGYPIGYNDKGNTLKAFTGKISEIVSETMVSVHLKGYRNPFVDFRLDELRFLKDMAPKCSQCKAGEVDTPAAFLVAYSDDRGLKRKAWVCRDHEEMLAYDGYALRTIKTL